jgi:hypothetical protein
VLVWAGGKIAKPRLPMPSAMTNFKFNFTCNEVEPPPHPSASQWIDPPISWTQLKSVPGQLHLGGCEYFGTDEVRHNPTEIF